jgi:sRNA-binding protein
VCEAWPHLFAEPLRPLAVGIRERIEASLVLDDAGRRALRDTLARHVRRRDYLEAIIAGRERIGLDGGDAGAPEARHIEHAREALAYHLARREAEAQRTANKAAKAAKAAAAALRAQAKAQRPAQTQAAILPKVLKPAPIPEPQARLLVTRTKPIVIIRKRRRIAEGRL